ncbi:MAG: hypothetical protein ACMG55_09515, partial [Microcoleus sp.]
MKLSHQQIVSFRNEVWQYYRENARNMPWRETVDPYFILVSEVMLQQTQVVRVVPKYTAFVTRFPTITSLATATLAEVLELWSGLGYNRRAKFLWLAAREVTTHFGGQMPQTVDGLTKLPGIGPNTAGAIMAYAYNQPVVFVETNIRTVYFHHFFTDQVKVADKEISALLSQTIDSETPREWYWALMDYGSYLKAQAGSHLQKSAHYTKQPPLAGSLREVRGQILNAQNAVVVASF